MENDIIQNDVTDNNGSVTDNDTQEPASVPSFRLREETEKRREAEAKLAEYESKLKETEAQIQQAKFETEKQYAKEMYGDYVDDPSVQEYKTKYPDLNYKQIFGALGINVSTHGHSGTPARAAGSMSNDRGGVEYTVSDLSAMRDSNPTEYKRVMADYANGKITVKPG